MSVGPGIDEGVCSDDELYNPCKLPGDVWEPDPKTIVELYEKLDKVVSMIIYKLSRKDVQFCVGVNRSA